MAVSVIGQRVPRVEGVEKVTGAVLYSADVKIPGTIWGKSLRSPYAYARIKRIDAGKARRLPGVLAVITAQDVPPTLVGRRLRDLPVLARDVVRFIGERVAAVAAEEKDVAEAALDLIDVEYEELEPLLDPLRAMSEEAPLLHPDLFSYAGLPPTVTPDLKNVHSYLHWEKGDLAAGFAEADEIVEGTYETGIVHQAYIEPHASTVMIGDDGRVHVWAAQKAPYSIREHMAEALGLPLDQVVIEYSRVGGEFGGKGALMDAPLCYYLAKASGRPVRMVMTYTEEFVAGNPRHRSYVQLRTGVKRDGTLTALQSHVIFDSGAYGAFKPVPDVSLGGAAKSGGAYRIPNTRIDSYIVYTNHVPGGFMRAPGDPQVIFALESHLDEVAWRIGMDSLEFRRHNLLREGDTSAIGERWTDLHVREVLDAAVANSNHGKPKPRPNIGRGIAMTNRHIGGGLSEVLLRVTEQGQVQIISGTADAGQGSHTIQRQVVAQVLTIPMERVVVVVDNTDNAPPDPGIGGARTTHVTGQAAISAAHKVSDELRGWAAELRGWQEDLVELVEGSFVLPGDAGQPVPFEAAAAEAVRRRGGRPVEVRASYAKQKVEEECFAAQVAEVEVDPETGQVTVLRISTAHDTGTLINPMAAEGQIEGGVVQGLGFALMEEVLLEDGKVANPNFGEYKIPTMRDIPELGMALIEDAGGPLPFNGKAVSEHSLTPTAGAIANAIRDAVGVRISSTPITSEKVYRALRELE